MGQKKTTEQFIKEAIEKHGDKYDYSNVVYTTTNSKVRISCKIHGDFEQRASAHLNGSGCICCAGIKKKTTEEFIIKGQEIHGDKYDYSKVEYKKAVMDVIIICKIHGEFLQKPIKHTTGMGCIKCGHTTRGDNLRKPKDDFINVSLQLHGDKYDYSKVVYTTTHSKVIITCKIHGDFEQTPSSHLRGSGCAECVRTIWTRPKFIEKSKEIHCDKYEYSNVDYSNCDKKVIITCKIHGDFEQTPYSHLKGQGCVLCSGKYKSNTNEFIEKSKVLHGDTYDYTKVEYVNSHKHVIIGCKKHGLFSQSPTKHLSGDGCYKCGYESISNKKRLTQEEIIDRFTKIHGNKYDYSKINYNFIHEKVIIICKIHGEFLQVPNSHLHGCGCPMCINKTEGKLYEKLLPLYPTLITQFKQDWCKKTAHLPFDFCIPEHKIIVELDGPQHFQQISNWSSPEEQFENDKYKETCANDNGYSVIRLTQEDVFYDTYDWLSYLCESIEELKNGDEVANIYLCRNGEYGLF